MYRAPIQDLRFVIEELLGAARLAGTARFPEFSTELAAAVLEEAGRFAAQVLAPINRLGDERGVGFEGGRVHMPAEFRDAYRRFVEGGWPQIAAAPQYGGQGQPQLLAAATDEIWFGANLAFALCPLLGRGAVESLERNASPEMAARLLPAMVSGRWTGTMNLTEPQAGSDLSAIRTRAVPEGDHYRIIGQKIFITFGEHDLTENIVHMVLARIDGAPQGVRGISMFAVPKRLLGPDGQPGELNDLRCVSLEHKLGIHASPTCVMAYGDRGGAVGYLIGEPHHGLEYMFVMMNAARLSVGVQGVGLSELALQQARDWASSRVQGRAVGSAASDAQPILAHPDVRRMLLTIGASVEAMRALALYAALSLDLGHAEADESRRAPALARGELLIPIVKGWCTEQATELASVSLQIHGGMGFIEETGAAQTLRDARITSIYEGTTGIQANDLLGRKLLRDRGAAMAELLAEWRAELAEPASEDPTLQSVRRCALAALTALEEATDALLALAAAQPAQAYAVSVPYLHLCGWALGGALLARAARLAVAHLRAPTTAGVADPAFYRAKLQTARFYAEHLLPRVQALRTVVQRGGASVAEADGTLI